MTDPNGPSGDRAIRGVVFSIQRYSIQDGPGIRSTVFLKGCPLRCEWCSNPESQAPTAELMVRVQKCQGCGKCVESCGTGAARIENNAIRVDRDLCDSCFKCVDVCPTGTLEITGKTLSVEEVLDEVCRDELFYDNSGGGVTLSGGEPLFQPEFAEAFFRACKENSLHTTLDTSGFANWETMRRVLRYTDLVLFDLKHLDSESHFARTQVKNDRILDNLRKTVNTEDTRVWIRIPVIKGYNDSRTNIDPLIVLLKELPVEKISLLNYHEWGTPKYGYLGKSYPLKDAIQQEEEDLLEIKTLLESGGLTITIGY
jgi:pyruvate formate lyase activating enzyme